MEVSWSGKLVAVYSWGLRYLSGCVTGVEMGYPAQFGGFTKSVGWPTLGRTVSEGGPRVS